MDALCSYANEHKAFRWNAMAPPHRSATRKSPCWDEAIRLYSKQNAKVSGQLRVVNHEKGLAFQPNTLC